MTAEDLFFMVWLNLLLDLISLFCVEFLISKSSSASDGVHTDGMNYVVGKYFGSMGVVHV